MRYALKSGALLFATIVSAMVLGMWTVQDAAAQNMSPFGMWGDDERFERRYRSRPPVGQYRRERYADPWYDDDFDEPPRRSRKKAQSAPSERVASGGAQPYITAETPPEVDFDADYAPGSIVIDVGDRKLYLVEGNGSALAYPIGVGREGFSWTGSEKVSRVADWPDWHPPAEMRQRQPKLPTKMTGGLRNPLGARAIYLGNTLYRIHGTNDPKSIGTAQSSGCFRMLNAHVVDLAERVNVGTEVHVVAQLNADAVASRAQKSVPDDYDEDPWLDPPPSYRR